jgi:hypothetical protein
MCFDDLISDQPGSGAVREMEDEDNRALALREKFLAEI